MSGEIVRETGAGLRTKARVGAGGSAPADASSNGAPHAAYAPCENCGKRKPTRKVEWATRGKLGLPVAAWLCDECAAAAELVPQPEKRKPRRKTKNRRATTDFHEQVEEILYRQAGATADQVARWLVLMTDDFDHRPKPYKAALEAAYRALRAMREAGVAEAIAIRRKWLGKKAGVAGSGRREDFYRLKKDGDAVVEGALLADVDGTAAKKGYARPWYGGAIEHASHRGDVMLLLAEQAAAWGVDIDPFSIYGETHPDFPLVGYELPRVDAAGVEKPARENASHTYERVVPDGAFVAVFGDAEESPSEGSGGEHDRHDPDDRPDFDGSPDYGGGSYEESETGEEVYA